MSIKIYLQELEDRLAIASEAQEKLSQALGEVAAAAVFLREALEAEEHETGNQDD